MRPRTNRRMLWSGQDVGMCTRICVFISTTRAAILMRRRRKVSNWATRQMRTLRHRGAQPPHQPVGAGMQEQPELVGGRLGAGGAVRGQMGLPGLDVIFGLPAPAIDLLVEPVAAAASRLVTMKRVSVPCAPASTRAMMRSTRLQLPAPS